MSDARVAFLVWFVGIAIVIAAFLIFVEIRLKRRRIREAEKRKEKTPIDRMKIFLDGDAGIREKLDAIGTTAKNYFKAEYGLELTLDYGELAKEFGKINRDLEAKFCGEMFEAYYSDHKLTKRKILSLGKMLVEIGRRKKISVSLSNVPSFGDRMDRFFEDVSGILSSRVKKYVKIKNERLERDARVAARQERELLSWVKKAIRIGYDKAKILDLLSDGTRSKAEIKRALKVYDSEVKKLSGNKVESSFYNKSGGIAQRIIKEEKIRLEEVEADLAR